MKSFLRMLGACGLLVLLISCASKEMKLSDFSLRDAGAPVTSVALEIDLSRELTLPPLPEGCDVSLQAEPATLSAALNGNLMTLCSSAVGDGSVTLHFSAKGYRSASYVLPVRTALHPMTLSVSGVPGDALTLPRGEQRVLAVQCTEGATLTAISSDPGVLSLSRDGTELILVARTPGTVTLTLEAARESYADARRELSVTVEAIPADFQLENEAMTLSRQGCATVSLWPSVGDATLAFRYDAEALTLRTSALAPDANHAAGFELALTANRSGVFPVEITLTADGYLPSTQTLTVTAVDPSVTLRLADTASLPVGEALRLAYSVTPADAAVTVSVTGGLRATIESGAILLEGIDAGRSTVSLSASADGYRSAAASASVLVIPSVDTDAYAAEAQRLLWLTNQERLAAGLPELVHRPELDAPATRRAEEAIQQWSHTRPDGRGCETVYDEFGLVYQNMGENLFAANVEDAELAISELMASAAHRENILRSVFTGIGVGVTRSRDGDTYYCQLFIA